MATESIQPFIEGLKVAEKSRCEALESISDILFRLACFLAKLDRTHVRSIAANGFIGPIPANLSPCSLYEWRFWKIGTVRNGDLYSISLLGNEL